MFSHPFYFQPMSLYLKWHSIVEPCFKIHSDNLSHLISVFRPFTFNAIIGIMVLKYTILFFLFCLVSVFLLLLFICFSILFYLSSQELLEYSLELYFDLAVMFSTLSF